MAGVGELLPNRPTCYLALVAATVTARERIRRETNLILAPHNILADAENVFSSYCDASIKLLEFLMARNDLMKIESAPQLHQFDAGSFSSSRERSGF